MFPDAKPREGMYESFYLRLVSPREPLGAWIRYTVHKHPGAAPRGSVWCTVFGGRGGPFMCKQTSDAPQAPAGAWIEIADARLSPGLAEGGCGEARWSLRIRTDEAELRHLAREALYRAPLPRTKLTSPAPAALFEGTLSVGGRAIEVDGWPGMVGHNWGAQHAERWIWLHGIAFQDAPGAWLDVAIGRVRLAGMTTPWVANGALSLDGQRLRLGGIAARGLYVAETASRCSLSIPGAGGLRVDAHVEVPPGTSAGWRYADPGGGEHDVLNCSIAALTVSARPPGGPARVLRTDHGAAYELGMREHDHGVPVAPFADG